MQNKLAYCDGYMNESEIILNPGAKYREITRLTPEMLKQREELLKIMEEIHGLSPKERAKIHFYEEI